MDAVKYLYLNSRDEFYRVDISKIVFFEADGNYTNFILTNKLKGMVRLNLSQIASILSKNLKEQASIFARVGKCHIVNLNYVFRLEPLRQRLTLSDGATFAYSLTVSKEALKKLKECYVAPVKGMNKGGE